MVGAMMEELRQVVLQHYKEYDKVVCPIRRRWFLWAAELACSAYGDQELKAFFKEKNQELEHMGVPKFGEKNGCLHGNAIACQGGETCPYVN